eukprot:scaffold39374_cov50-Prasinocladus_malaysianus.AAC.3
MLLLDPEVVILWAAGTRLFNVLTHEVPGHDRFEPQMYCCNKRSSAPTTKGLVTTVFQRRRKIIACGNLFGCQIS